ncbi:MAG: RidA family protein [Candidatus Paceibacterota bacterium]
MIKVYGSSEQTSAPLSSAVEANGLVFVSGQIHADSAWKLQGKTTEEKFALIMTNIEVILAASGLSKKDIIQIRLYLTNLSELPVLNEIYKQYFDHPFPARTAVGVSQLPLGATLEIEVVASR